MKKASKKQREPSKASLKEMPEIDVSKAKVHRGRSHAKQIEEDGGYWIEVDGEEPYFVRTKMGRPEKGSVSAPSKTKSVRFTEEVWEAVEKIAKAKGITTHAALREAVAEWLKENADAAA